MAEDNCEIRVSGWGPCFHSEQEATAIQEWIDHLEPPRDKKLLVHGGQMEDLAWLINLDYNGTTELVADQWVAAIVNGTLHKTDSEGHILDHSKKWRYHIFLESDTFLAAMAGCYACLKWKQAEINEGLHDENYCPNQ